MAYRSGDNIVTFKPTFLPFILIFQLTLLLVRIVSWSIFRIRIYGRENLRKAGSSLLVSNHTLVLDPGLIAQVLQPSRTYFTMLEETALIPYLGTYVRLLGAIPIPQGSFSRLEKGIRSGLDMMNFVHFFPEGECYRWNQEIKRFSPGAFFFAIRLQIPIVPITTVLHERKTKKQYLFGKLRIPPRVSIYVGEPIYPQDFPHGTGDRATSIRAASESLGEMVRSRMQRTIDESGGCKTIDRGAMPRLVKENR